MSCETCAVLEKNPARRGNFHRDLRRAADKDPRCTKARHHVLYYLTDVCRPNGTGYLTQKMLAEKIGWSEDAIGHALSWLADHGYLVVVSRGYRGQHTDVKLTMPEKKIDRSQRSIPRPATDEIDRSQRGDRPFPAVLNTSYRGTDGVPPSSAPGGATDVGTPPSLTSECPKCGDKDVYQRAWCHDCAVEEMGTEDIDFVACAVCGGMTWCEVGDEYCPDCKEIAEG